MPVFKRYMQFSARSWSSETSLRASTLLILIFTYAVTLFLVQSAFNFKGIMNRWGDSTKLTVYLSEGQTPETRQKIQDYIKALPEVKSMKVVSQQEAMAQFSAKNSIFAEDFIEDLKNQEVFPESIDVTLKGSLKDQAYFAKLSDTSKAIEGQIGVDEVSYGKGWIEKYAAFLRLTNSLVGVIVFLFIFASLLIISNLIRVLVYNQHEEIEILELIGETAQNIRLPFIIEGMVFSGVAFTVGITLNMVIFNWISAELAQSSILSHLADVIGSPAIWFAFIGLALSVSVGLVSSYMTVRSINTGWALSKRTN